ncbi:MAG: cytochrome P450 [Candidatus Azotimanducaceae bacterium]|jgi:cytochrome P450
MAMPSYDAYIDAKDNRDLSRIPGTYGYPVIGHTFDFLKSPLVLMLGEYRKYGPVFRQSLAFQRMVATVGPDMVKLVTLDPEKLFSSRMGWEGLTGEYFSGSLMLMDFDDHRLQRRLMQTAFKSAALRGYMNSVNTIIRDTIISWPTQQSLAFYPTIKALLLDIAAKVFLGAQLNEEGAALNRAFIDFADGTVGIIKKDWPGLLHHKGLNGRRVLEKFIWQSIDSKRETEGTDMFSHFCHEKNQDGEFFSHQEITDHMIFLLFAAHDTTTSALTMVMHLLAGNQDWQQQLRAQIVSSSNDTLDYDQRDSISLMDYTFNEVLRMYPPVVGVIRRTIKPSVIAGHEVAAHTVVQTSILANHYLEEYWRDPFVFDPMRFAAGRQEHKQHPYLWAPFGGGAHKCIGLHFADILFKTVLFQVIGKYNVKFVDEKQRDHKIQYVPFPKPKDNLPLVLNKL